MFTRSNTTRTTTTTITITTIATNNSGGIATSELRPISDGGGVSRWGEVDGRVTIAHGTNNDLSVRVAPDSGRGWAGGWRTGRM